MSGLSVLPLGAVSEQGVTMSRSFGLLMGLTLLLVPAWLRPAGAQVLQPAAAPVALDFESFPDGTLLTNQYAGVVFSNAQILSAGASLNEQEAPPHSGVNVVSDDGGPMSLVFTTPVTSFGGYFNYNSPLTLDAYDASSTLIGSAQSLFTDNFALSGDAGSSPNELIELSPVGDISSIIITGNPGGGSFTLDDASFTPLTTPLPPAVPEPNPGMLLLVGLVTLAARRRTVASHLS